MTARELEHDTPVAHHRERLSGLLPILMLVVDGANARDTALMRGAIDGGVSVVQLRDRTLDTTGMTILAQRLRRSFGDDAFLLVNGDLDAATAGGADGVHLPEEAEGLAAAGSILTSRAVHSVEAAVQAERDGADLLVVGTVFPSKSHAGGPTIGLDGVKAVCDAVRVPVIGIGGITAQNAGDVIRAGASGVAVISAILDAADAQAAASALRGAIDEAWRER